MVKNGDQDALASEKGRERGHVPKLNDVIRESAPFGAHACADEIVCSPHCACAAI